MTIVRRAMRTILGLALWVSAQGAGSRAWSGEELPAWGEGLDQLRVQVTVDPTRSTHTISPYIFGASAVDPKRARELGVSTVRWGGNRSWCFNWKAQADNAGSDWFFLNGKAGRWSEFITGNRKAGLASYLTVPLLPWVAKGPEGWGFSVAKYGPQAKSSLTSRTVATASAATASRSQATILATRRFRRRPSSRPRASRRCRRARVRQSSLDSTTSRCSGRKPTATFTPRHPVTTRSSSAVAPTPWRSNARTLADSSPAPAPGAGPTSSSRPPTQAPTATRPTPTAAPTAMSLFSPGTSAR